jgi:hypothetical protein
MSAGRIRYSTSVVQEQSEEWLPISCEGGYFYRRFSDRVCFICAFSAAAYGSRARVILVTAL